MGRFIEMVGRRFWRLTVVERLPSPARRIRYRCLCDCGNFTEAYGENIRRGHVKSCGCYRIEHTIAKNTTHGKAGTRTYKIWKGITKRCKDQKDRNYGARGITMCERWKDYEAFLADMGECPDGLSIDRIDVNGPYAPENCRWANRTTQMRNMRRTVRLTVNGVTLPVIDWAEMSGLKYYTLLQRVRANCQPEHIFRPPHAPQVVEDMKNPLMTENDVSDLLQVKVPTLRSWRSQGKGPTFIKVGAAVRYRPADIEAWLDSRASSSPTR